MRTHEYSKESALWAHNVLERAYYSAQEYVNDMESVATFERNEKIILITDIGRCMKSLGYIMSIKQFDKLWSWNNIQLAEHLQNMTELVIRKHDEQDCD